MFHICNLVKLFSFHFENESYWKIVQHYKHQDKKRKKNIISYLHNH